MRITDSEFTHRLYGAFKREPSELSLSELELKAHRIAEDDDGSDAYDIGILTLRSSGFAQE